MGGFVYVGCEMDGLETGPCLIGYAGNLEDCLRRLQLGAWRRLVVFYAERCGGGERKQVFELREKLREKRIRGDWYGVTPQEAVKFAASKDGVELTEAELSAVNYSEDGLIKVDRRKREFKLPRRRRKLTKAMKLERAQKADRSEDRRLGLPPGTSTYYVDLAREFGEID